MKLENSILKLFLLLATLVTLSNCATGQGVTEIDPCVEIPFLDGPEGACTNTVTHKAFIIPADEWKKIRPTMIMIKAEHWTKIKLDWLKGCRMLIRDGNKCNVAVDSIDKAVERLGTLVKNFKGQSK